MLEPEREGSFVDGQYRVDRQLGRGAFGVVWLAHREDNGQLVVLKVLHQQWARVPTVVERFRREGQVAGKINHPHVARVYGYGSTDDGVPFIALEYLPGHTLKEELKQSGPMSPERAAELWAPVCDAVAMAHMMGIVHRDLKPENIILTPRDGNPSYPVVLDFGIAKFLDSAEKLTSTGTMLGTPTYMAPEQCRGQQDLGPAADVYSLGAICFELIAGVPPFTGKTIAELAMKHLLDQPPPLTMAPPALADTVARCLAKEPEQRPAASALSGALRQSVGLKAPSIGPRGAESTKLAGMGGISADRAVLGVPSPVADTMKPRNRAATPTPARVGPTGTVGVGPQVPESSVASTVMMTDAGKNLDAAVLARLKAAKARPATAKAPGPGSGPPLIVLIAVGLALAAVGALLAVLVLR